jgi:hypothetical protein
MPVMTDETSKAEPARGSIMSRISMPEFWATLAIVAIWLAVLFDGVFGADFVSGQADSYTRVPSSVFVAFFGVLATSSVAKRAFGRSSRPE